MIEYQNRPILFKNNLIYQGFAKLMLSRPLLLAIFVGNAIGAIAGLLYWYSDQLQRAPWYLWIFIPDSPLSTFWVIPALLLILWHPPGRSWFNSFAAFGIIKYGLWTVIFWSLHWQS